MIFSFLSPLCHYPAVLYTINPAGHYIHQKLMIIIFFPSVLSPPPPSLCIHAQKCMCAFNGEENGVCCPSQNSPLNLAKIHIWLQSHWASMLDCVSTSHYYYYYINIYVFFLKNQLLACQPVCCVSLIPLLFVINNWANETVMEATHTFVPS